MTLPDIRAPHIITPDWLTAVLRAGGADAEVRSFTATRAGTGLIGDSVRFVLDYAHSEPDAPCSLVGKFPSEGEESRSAGVSLGTYAREVNVYKHLAASALIRTPYCYFTDVDQDTSDFVLMVEDLAPARQGDQLTGVTVEQAALVMDQAARLHDLRSDGQPICCCWGRSFAVDEPCFAPRIGPQTFIDRCRRIGVALL